MIAGIVCEYNPFHKGHLYQLEKTVEAGADAVVCVMSGNYVQRGECAFFDKWKRAEAAVHSGADVVIDLPVPWAVSSAENFARGSIFLLNNFGVGLLFFGSECDSKEKLLLASRVTGDVAVMDLVKKYMSEGKTYPLSLSEAVKKVYTEDLSKVISSPNSTLAVEYIRQLDKYNGMDFYPIKRIGAPHDSDEMNIFPSASKIRSELLENSELYKALPDISAEFLKSCITEGFAPCLMKNNERGIISSLREMAVQELKEYVSDENGLAERMYEGIRNSATLEELYENIKCRSYTHSRIRREVLNAYLKVGKDIARDLPPYIRILTVSQKGLSLLSSAKKNSAIPIVTRHGEMQNLDDKAKRIYEIQCSSTDKFALFSKKIRECGLEQKNSMIIVK